MRKLLNNDVVHHELYNELPISGSLFNQEMRQTFTRWPRYNSARQISLDSVIDRHDRGVSASGRHLYFDLSLSLHDFNAFSFYDSRHDAVSL